MKVIYLNETKSIIHKIIDIATICLTMNVIESNHIFNLKNICAVTLILCINHFMGIENIKVLEGMKTFEEIKTLEKLDKMEESNLKFISSNYENKILHSMPRNIE